MSFRRPQSISGMSNKRTKLKRSISLSVKVVSCLRMRWLWVGPSRSPWQLSAADNQRLPLSANVYQATATPLQRNRDLWNLNWRQSIINHCQGETKKNVVCCSFSIDKLNTVQRFNISKIITWVEFFRECGFKRDFECNHFTPATVTPSRAKFLS